MFMPPLEELICEGRESFRSPEPRTTIFAGYVGQERIVRRTTAEDHH